MAKVYNKKKNMYKGSLPGMRMGGGLTKARYGIPKAQRNIPEGSNIQDQPIAGLSESNTKPTGEELLQQSIENKRLDIENLMNEEQNLGNLNANISDSLYRDHQMKQQLQGLNTEFDDLSNITDFQKLEAACMRGDASACQKINAQGLTKEDILTRNINKYNNLSDYYNAGENDQRAILEKEGFSPTLDDNKRFARKIDEEAIKQIQYKRGGIVKKKRGGTILGGKYKMKKGGSTGRNGVL